MSFKLTNQQFLQLVWLHLGRFKRSIIKRKTPAGGFVCLLQNNHSSDTFLMNWSWYVLFQNERGLLCSGHVAGWACRTETLLLFATCCFFTASPRQPRSCHPSALHPQLEAWMWKMPAECWCATQDPCDQRALLPSGQMHRTSCFLYLYY